MSLNQDLDSTTFLIRCGHVLSAILKNIFIYFFNRLILLDGVGIAFYSVKFFSKACPDIFYADFPILQKGCHNILNIITLLRCR